MEENLFMALIVAGSVVLGLAIIVGLPVVMGVRHARFVRELQHAERMKALELGQPMPATPAEALAASVNTPGSPSGSPGAKIAVTVPLGALGIAWLTTTTPWQNGVASGMIWGAAGLVGVAAVICGTVLTIHDSARHERTRARGASPKPYQHDPDELDVAGRRG
jgi:hypothetical protein